MFPATGHFRPGNAFPDRPPRIAAPVHDMESVDSVLGLYAVDGAILRVGRERWKPAGQVEHGGPTRQHTSHMAPSQQMSRFGASKNDVVLLRRVSVLKITAVDNGLEKSINRRGSL